MVGGRQATGVGEVTGLGGAEKAAIVIMQMPDRVASAVLKEMTEVEVSRISRAIAELPDLELESVNQVMIEFMGRVETISSVKQGGIEAARRVLRERMGAARAEEEMEALLSNRGSRPFAFLVGLDPAQIAGFLADEHPQSAAVVVAYLPPETAASVLGAMEEERRADVALRVGTMGKVSPDALAAISNAMNTQLLDVAPMSDSGFGRGGGAVALAAILNRSDRSVERQILGQIENLDTELAEDIRRRLFTFDDVVNLDDRTLQKVLRSIQPKVLALALKGSKEDVQAVFTRNLSEGAAKDLVDEIAYLGTVRLVEVEGAQMDIARTVREMEAAGEIVIIRESDDVIS